MSEVHLELLLGKAVHDGDGHLVGHIEEVRAHRQSGEWVVKDYLVGPGAMVARLSARPLARFVAQMFGAGKAGAGRRIRWDQLDLSDPYHPRLTCSPEELEEFYG